MKKMIYLFAAALAVAGLSACDRNGDNLDPVDGTDARFMAIADRFVNHTVIPTYTSLSDYTEQLVNDLVALKSETTQTNLDKACETFLIARAYWEKSEAFLWGPATDFGIDPHIDTWPLDLVGLKEALTNSAQIDGLAGEDGDVYAGEKLGPTLLGFHGIEYVLFYEGENREASWFSEGNLDNGVKCIDYLTYAVAVAGDLRNKCWQMEIAWRGDDGTDGSRYEYVADVLEANVTMTNGSSYGENMLNSGKPGSTYATWRQAMQAILDGSVTIADEVANQKIGRPYLGSSEEDINYIESPYSYKSIQDFYDNMVSIKNVYYGGLDAESTGAASDSYDSVNSLHAYLAEVNPELDARLIAAIDKALAEINGDGTGMKWPFVNNRQDPSVGEAQEAVAELKI